MRIIKVGGGASINLEGVVKDLVERQNRPLWSTEPNAPDELAAKLGTPNKWLPRSLATPACFRRGCDRRDLMSYAGLRNKRLVELCQRHGVNAVGLTGIDGGVVKGARNKGIRVREGSKEPHQTRFFW